uniref:Uncharacterized protein n=1 Tax=Ciona savignyi TaxID=51511 RepID=H2ZBP1_CIOSA
MNPSSMPVLSKSLLPKLRSLPEDSPTYYIKMLIHCMVKWKMGMDLLSLIYDWFTASNSQPDQQKSSKKRKRSTSKTAKKSKLVCFIETTNDCRVAPALSYLRCCVDDHVIMDTLLADQQCFEKLESIIEFLNLCTVEVTKRLHNNDPTMDKWSDAMLINALDIQASLLAQVF